MWYSDWTVRSWIPDCTTAFLSSPRLPDRLWGTPSLLFNGQRCSFTGVEQPRCEVGQLQVLPRLRISGAIPLLHLCAFMAWTGTLYLTYLLTPWIRVLLEKLTGFAASQEIPAFYGTRKFVTVFTSARHMSLS